MRWLSEELDRFVCERSLPYSVVEETVRNFLATNLEIAFNAPVEVAFSNGEIKAWVLNENAEIPHYVPVDIKSLPRGVIRHLKKKFPDYILAAEARIKYHFWRAYRHRAVEGVIIRADKHKVDVDLGKDQIGTMLKAHFIPKEILRPGDMKWFYVLKVYMQGSSVRVFLSRNSKSLPVALLEEKIPWGKFKCVKRIVGVKSVVVSNVTVPKEIIRELAEELGEVVIVRKCVL